VWLFFVYGGRSVLWSVYPFVSFKRWVKALGNVVMALIILTDRSWSSAVGLVLRRLTLVALPLSILFVRYYPELGRTYHMNLPMFTGIGTQKNSLGQLCVLGGVYSCWSLLYRRAQWIRIGGPLRIPIDLLVLAMVVWLMTIADSATSIVALMAAACLLVASRVRFIAQPPRRILNLGLACILVLVGLEQIVDLSTMAISALDRDPSLTTRVPMWEDLLGSAQNSFFGAGYEGYWNTDIGRMMAARWGSVIQAHNGYLEIYLNLGLVGLVILIGGMVAGVSKVARQLSSDRAAAVLRLAFLVAAISYNWTEATFRGASNMWLLLLLAIIDPPPMPSSQPNGELQQAKVAVKSGYRRTTMQLGYSGWQEGSESEKTRNPTAGSMLHSRRDS
jgi:O-antigen ligase